MVDATVDNTPVTVLLSDSETYTPASGSVQKVAVLVHVDEKLNIIQAGTTQQVKNNFAGAGEPNGQSFEMVIDDTVTLEEGGSSSGDGIYISGFEVS